jgi:hypothetical protein
LILDLWSDWSIVWLCIITCYTVPCPVRSPVQVR